VAKTVGTGLIKNQSKFNFPIRLNWNLFQPVYRSVLPVNWPAVVVLK
jgi:hypothetical protein